MKIVFALALGLGLSLPLASPASAQTRSTAAARVLHRQKLARMFPQVSFQTNAVPTKVGRPLDSASSRTTSAVTARASNTLNFTFSGFSNSEAAELKGFIDKNYNLIVKVWGAPAPEQLGKTVQIVSYATDPQRDDYTSQTYYPPASTNPQGGRIEFEYTGTTITGYNAFQLVKLVLNAFQGPRIPAVNFAKGRFFEVYSLGASEAAALHILYQALGSPSTFDPRTYTSYVLPYYDAYNSPSLGSPFIYPPSGEDIVVSDFRLAVAQAAFLKLYSEKESFFSDFNTALYKQGTARSPLTADTLESVGASVLSTVEGLPYRSWIREQGALNVRVSTGSKLYILALPLPPETASGQPSIVIFAEAFTTDSSGEDVALYPGAAKDKDGDLVPVYGSIDAFDETGRNINSYAYSIGQSSKVLIFGGEDPSEKGLYPGEAYLGLGFRPFSSGASARVKLSARLNSTEGTSFVPLGATGTLESPATYYGATLGGTSGSIKLTVGTQTQNIVIGRGTFSGTLPLIGGPRVQATLSDGTHTLKRNLAWAPPATKDLPLRAVEFRLEGAGGASASSTLSLNASNGRLKMIAFPLRPNERDEAKILNVTPESLALARFRPDLSPATTKDGGLVFGIGGSKYEVYPNISQGPEAGNGYWIKIPASGLIRQVEGVFPPTNQVAEVELKNGWNQIGVPRATAVGALNVKVRYGGYSPVSLQEAQSRGWIATGVWRYNGSSGYQRVDVSGGTLAPWEGYWVFASPGSGTSLVFEPTTSTQSVRALSSSNGSWSLGIAASSSTSRDESASFGVSAEKTASKPPVATQQLSVYFPPADTASSSGGGSAQSFLKKLAAKNEWKFTLDGATKGERVTLYWPGFKNVPSNLQLQLRDEATKKIVTTMKSGSKWSFTSDGKPHQFTVVGTLIATGNSAKSS